MNVEVVTYSKLTFSRRVDALREAESDGEFNLFCCLIQGM